MFLDMIAWIPKCKICISWISRMILFGIWNYFKRVVHVFTQAIMSYVRQSIMNNRTQRRSFSFANEKSECIWFYILWKNTLRIFNVLIFRKTDVHTDNFQYTFHAMSNLILNVSGNVTNFVSQRMAFKVPYDAWIKALLKIHTMAGKRVIC